MSKFYSQSTGGFYAPEIHNQIPSDVVEITDQEWLDLLDGQTKGRVIQFVNGKPSLVDAPIVPVVELTPAEKLAKSGLTVAELKGLLGL